LRNHEADRKAGIDQFLQGRDGEGGCSGEDEVHAAIARKGRERFHSFQPVV
jgi:hypothetical protein